VSQRPPERAREFGPSGKALLEVRRLGRMPYAAAHALQEELVAARVDGRICDQLLLVEHDPVITVGRGGEPQPAEQGGVPIVEVERGGEATYHGPGQLVAYPIVRLEGAHRDLHRYLRDLEEVVIRMLQDLGVRGLRKPGLTGVWVGERKICSVGVAVRRWVAWHGLALNVTTDLAAFRTFRPCGLDPDVMTRLADHVEPPADDPLLERSAVSHFCAVFGRELARPTA
jgi:lipoyl(octanoyl) transferase